MSNGVHTESNNNIGYQGLDQTKKRMFDLSVGTIGGLITGVLIALPTAIALKIESASKSVIFKQIRQGKDNKPFTLYKFRTLDDQGAPTKVGAFLRKHSLDEILQLWNVVKGDMSITGYRPREYNNLETLPIVYNILRRKPALTGKFQIAYGNGLVPRAETEQEKEIIKRQYEAKEAQERFSLKSECVYCFNTGSIIVDGKKDRSLSSTRKNLAEHTTTNVETIKNATCAISANNSFHDSTATKSTKNHLPEIAMNQTGFINPSIITNEKDPETPKL